MNNIMTKAKYKNFEDYQRNDYKFMIRILKDEIHKYQSKITFADGSTYHVTKAGSRYWHGSGQYYWHREDGPIGIFKSGHEMYALGGESCSSREEWESKLVDYKKNPHMYFMKIKNKKLGIPEDFIFVDIEPMIIEIGENVQWTHPYIDTWFNPEDEYDCDIYHIEYTNESGENLTMYFKSKYIDSKIEEFFMDTESESLGKQDMFSDTYVNLSEVFSSIETTLLDDCFGVTPGPQISDDYVDTTDEEFYKKYPREQFCFSEIGEKVGEFFDSDTEITLFTPDCGLTTDGTLWWCDS